MIIKRIIATKENIFYSNNGDILSNFNTLNFNKKTSELNNTELNSIEIINLLESTRGIGIEHFTFDYKNFHCVMIYDKNDSLKKKLSEIDKYPIIKKQNENVIQNCDIRLIAFIYLYKFKPSDSLPELTIYSFKNTKQREIVDAFEFSGKYLIYDYINNIVFFSHVKQICAYRYLGEDFKYYENGNIKSKSFTYSYENDECFDDYFVKVDYHPNGNLSKVCNYLNDKQIGNFVSYYPNGTILIKGSYMENGDKFGVWEEYYNNGILKEKGEYNLFGGGFEYDEIWNDEINDVVGGMYPCQPYTEKDGEWVEYYINGKIKAKTIYNEGNVVLKHKYDE